MLYGPEQGAPRSGCKSTRAPFVAAHMTHYRDTASDEGHTRLPKQAPKGDCTAPLLHARSACRANAPSVLIEAAEFARFRSEKCREWDKAPCPLCGPLAAPLHPCQRIVASDVRPEAMRSLRQPAGSRLLAPGGALRLPSRRSSGRPTIRASASKEETQTGAFRGFLSALLPPPPRPPTATDSKPAQVSRAGNTRKGCSRASERSAWGPLRGCRSSAPRPVASNSLHAPPPCVHP